MRVLVIDAAARAAIAEAIKRAEAHPLPLEFIRAGAVEPGKAELKLADRKPGFARPASEQVIIPHGYRVAFSIEEQPIGLCGHLSISVDAHGKLPSPEAVSMIAKEYGITWPGAADATTWLEEFEPGHRAVNLVALRRPAGVPS